MIPIQALFETHVTVSNLEHSMAFYGDALGLELAKVFPERKVAFYWIGEHGKSMLGIWETGSAPQRMSLHLAMHVELADMLKAADRLQETHITPLDFDGNP